VGIGSPISTAIMAGAIDCRAWTGVVDKIHFPFSSRMGRVIVRFPS